MQRIEQPGLRHSISACYPQTVRLRMTKFFDQLQCLGVVAAVIKKNKQSRRQLGSTHRLQATFQVFRSVEYRYHHANSIRRSKQISVPRDQIIVFHLKNFPDSPTECPILGKATRYVPNSGGTEWSSRFAARIPPKRRGCLAHRISCRFNFQEGVS